MPSNPLSSFARLLVEQSQTDYYATRRTAPASSFETPELALLACELRRTSLIESNPYSSQRKDAQ